jgi:hypothetical protein
MTEMTVFLFYYLENGKCENGKRTINKIFQRDAKKSVILVIRRGLGARDTQRTQPCAFLSAACYALERQRLANVLKRIGFDPVKTCHCLGGFWLVVG